MKKLLLTTCAILSLSAGGAWAGPQGGGPSPSVQADSNTLTLGSYNSKTNTTTKTSTNTSTPTATIDPARVDLKHMTLEPDRRHEAH